MCHSFYILYSGTAELHERGSEGSPRQLHSGARPLVVLCLNICRDRIDCTHLCRHLLNAESASCLVVAGSYWGQSALFANMPHMCSIVAREPCVILVLRRHKLKFVFDTLPKVKVM